MATAINYPKELLPLPTVSFNGSKQSGLEVTAFESGATRQRNRYNDKRRLASITLELSNTEFDIFKSFWDYKLNNGSSNFNAYLYVDGGSYEDYEVTPLKGVYKFKHFGVGFWKISFQALLIEQRYISEELLDYLILQPDTNFDTLDAYEDRYDVLINTNLPTDILI